jgi:site-specific DNA-methyltransferase (adenine-specific)
MTIHPGITICSAEELLCSIPDGSIDLILTDPPYNGIVKSDWDNASSHAEWLSNLFIAYKSKLKEHGSIVFFAALGKHGNHPIFDVVKRMESEYTFRNWITWKKRRAYGKSHDYLYTREEILWFSKSQDRTNVRFNIPYTSEIRGYDGFDKDHPAKSKFKRVSNVWIDIGELFRPTRECEKPLPLMRRLVETHSNPGDTILDFCY